MVRYPRSVVLFVAGIGGWVACARGVGEDGTDDAVPTRGQVPGTDPSSPSAGDDRPSGDRDEPTTGTTAGATGGSATGGLSTGGATTGGTTAGATDGTNAGSTTGATPAPSCADVLAKLRFDFETDDAGFTHAALDGLPVTQGGFTYSRWARGTPQSGLGRCPGGNACFATGLSGNYGFCERGELRSPTMDLSACASEDVRLTFSTSYEFMAPYSHWGQARADGGIVEFSSDGGNTWTVPLTVPFSSDLGIGLKYETLLLSVACPVETPVSISGKRGVIGASSGIQTVSIPIPPLMRTSGFRVRFAYATGMNALVAGTQEDTRAQAKPGWIIDDVAVTRP